MHGKDGADIVVPVPPGTVLPRPRTPRSSVADLTRDGETFVFLRGGRGGKGNSHYATSVNQAPRYAQKGIEGETRELRAELHLIADIGLVGMPNAGKSTLLSVLTNAHPLIGDYPFTTRTPNLGLLRLPERDVILADIPGIIEGASQGSGLGLKFLRHIERCAALLFLVDLSAPDCPGTVHVLQAELATYSEAPGRPAAPGRGNQERAAGLHRRAGSACRGFPAGRFRLRSPRSHGRDSTDLVTAIRGLVPVPVVPVGREHEGGRAGRDLQPGALWSPFRRGRGAGGAGLRGGHLRARQPARAQGPGAGPGSRPPPGNAPPRGGRQPPFHRGHRRDRAGRAVVFH